MTRGPAKSRRILVGAASFADAESALNLVRLVAGGMSSDLIGLMAEDLSQIMDEVLPAGGLVTMSGQLVAPPNREELAKLIQSERRAFRVSLARVAGALSAGWSFETRTGTLEKALSTWQESWDILLLGHRKLHRRRGPVVLIAEGGSKDEAAASVAHSLAAAMGVDVLALEFGAAGKGGVSANGEDEHTPTTTGFADRTALLAHVGRMNITAVVLTLATGPFRSIPDLRQVLELARCPLVVLAGERSGD